MSSRSQLALLLNEPSGPYVIEQIPFPPPPQSGEILIKIQAAGLNPADWKIVKYAIKVIDKYPAIVGSDIAGCVEAVGEDVANFRKGDRVVCQAQGFEKGGGYQQYILVGAEFVSKIPEATSYDEAVTLPLALSTAYSGLYAELPHGIGLSPENKHANTPFVILGGATAVGQAVIQLVRMMEFSPIIITASSKNAEALKKLGATHVLNRDLLPKEVVAEIKGILLQPLVHIFDAAMSDSSQKLAVEIGLAAKEDIGDQKYVALATPCTSVSPPTDDRIKIARVFGGASPYNAELFKSLYGKRLFKWLETGSIVANRVEVLPDGLAGVVDGLKRLEEDTVSRLKLVVHPQEIMVKV